VNKIKRCIKDLEKFSFVTSVYSTTGNFSIHVLAYFDDLDDLNNFISQKLSQMPIQDFLVTTILEKHKENYYQLE
jgi:DNA-binding Lrp family transcriptional regulator